jgi:guanylate kinase
MNQANEASQRAQGLLVVVSSPSGAGKTTLCQRLMREFPNLVFSVSYTTRPMRPGEREGSDYHFVDEATFNVMIERGDFAEHAHVHGHRYGTTRRFVEEARENGKDVLFDIDYQGGRQLKSGYEKYGYLVMVFILPPSIAELERRLRSRATESEAVIERRLAKAREEIEHYHFYDYLIVNDDLDRAYDQLRGVYLAAHSEKKRMAAMAEQLVSESKSYSG